MDIANWLVDDEWYLSHYVDVQYAKQNAKSHYAHFGQSEHRQPNPFFNPQWYKKTYLNQQSNTTPLSHYLKQGYAQGHQPCAHFFNIIHAWNQTRLPQDRLYLDPDLSCLDSVSPLQHLMEFKYYSHVRSMGLSFHLNPTMHASETIEKCPIQRCFGVIINSHVHLNYYNIGDEIQSLAALYQIYQYLQSNAPHHASSSTVANSSPSQRLNEFNLSKSCSTVDPLLTCPTFKDFLCYIMEHEKTPCGIKIYFISRDMISNFRPDDERDRVITILNGWWMHEQYGKPEKPFNFPPSRYIIPMLTSMHLTSDMILNPATIHYMHQYGPVGCRDLSTKLLLESRDIPCYLSGCLTTTLYNICQLHPTQDLLLVDAPDIIVRQHPSAVTMKATSVQPSTDITRLMDAYKVLEKFSQFKAIITTRIHCFIPARALGIPCTILRKDGRSFLVRQEFKVELKDRHVGLIDILSHPTESQNHLNTMASHLKQNVNHFLTSVWSDQQMAIRKGWTLPTLPHVHNNNVMHIHDASTSLSKPERLSHDENEMRVALLKQKVINDNDQEILSKEEVIDENEGKVALSKKKVIEEHKEEKLSKEHDRVVIFTINYFGYDHHCMPVCQDVPTDYILFTEKFIHIYDISGSIPILKKQLPPHHANLKSYSSWSAQNLEKMTGYSIRYNPYSCDVLSGYTSIIIYKDANVNIYSSSFVRNYYVKHVQQQPELQAMLFCHPFAENIAQEVNLAMPMIKYQNTNLKGMINAYGVKKHRGHYWCGMVGYNMKHDLRSFFNAYFEENYKWVVNENKLFHTEDQVIMPHVIDLYDLKIHVFKDQTRFNLSVYGQFEIVKHVDVVYANGNI